MQRLKNCYLLDTETHRHNRAFRLIGAKIATFFEDQSRQGRKGVVAGLYLKIATFSLQRILKIATFSAPAFQKIATVLATHAHNPAGCP